MASALSAGINAIKYADMRVNNGGVWGPPDEVWVHNGAWVEPKQIWANDAGTWKRVSTPLRFLKFDGSGYVNCGTNSFNNYVDGVVDTYHEFTFIVTDFNAVQTLFSYGSDTTYFTIEIGTDGKITVRSRYNSGTLRVVTHATVLTANVPYLVRIDSVNGTSVYIRLRDYAGNTVGTDVSGILASSLSTNTKFIGKKYNSTAFFYGYLLDINMFGGTYGGTDYRHDCNSFLSSTVGSATITDSYTTDGSQNLTASGLTVQETG